MNFVQLWLKLNSLNTIKEWIKRKHKKRITKSKLELDRMSHVVALPKTDKRRSEKKMSFVVKMTRTFWSKTYDKIMRFIIINNEAFKLSRNMTTFFVKLYGLCKFNLIQHWNERKRLKNWLFNASLNHSLSQQHLNRSWKKCLKLKFLSHRNHNTKLFSSSYHKRT